MDERATFCQSKGGSYWPFRGRKCTLNERYVETKGKEKTKEALSAFIQFFEMVALVYAASFGRFFASADLERANFGLSFGFRFHPCRRLRCAAILKFVRWIASSRPSGKNSACCAYEVYYHNFGREIGKSSLRKFQQTRFLNGHVSRWFYPNNI